MPDYVITHYYRDYRNGDTTRSYKGTFADDAAAEAAATAFDTDVIAATKSHMYKRTLSKVTDYAGAANANTNVFDTVSATMGLVGGVKKANISFPDPVDAMMAVNSLISTATEWVDFQANLEAASGWTISDGESVASTITGARQIVRSGKTNLPS